ncbi:unnamed protein product [Trichobilharzia szidati]|nr:unnamed protein product [Trichobilharzia szidati]
MRTGQGKEVISMRVMIRKYVKLDPDDEFSSATLIKRHGEQLKNKHKSSKWCRLHITNDELWLSGGYWWPNSILNGIHLSEINCLVTFYSTPNLLALGIASRLYDSEKEYVLLCTKSGTDRDHLVKTLTTLCGNRYKQTEKKFNIPIVGPPVNIVEISLSPEIKHSLNSERSVDTIQDSCSHSTTCNHHSDVCGQETIVNIEKPISSVYIQPSTTTFENTTKTTVDESISVDMCCNDDQSFTKLSLQKPQHEIQWKSTESVRPCRLKRFLSPYYEGLESGLNPKDLIHVYYDPKQGNVITQDGPIYLYCVNCPSE